MDILEFRARVKTIFEFNGIDSDSSSGAHAVHEITRAAIDYAADYADDLVKRLG